MLFLSNFEGVISLKSNTKTHKLHVTHLKHVLEMFILICKL
jgi:hypothetical protein